MVKNLPLLVAMLLIGCSISLIALTTNSPQFVKVFLLITGVVLNVWSMMGLILHIGIKKLSNNN
jgi:hypothetical protein